MQESFFVLFFFLFDKWVIARERKRARARGCWLNGMSKVARKCLIKAWRASIQRHYAKGGSGSDNGNGALSKRVANTRHVNTRETPSWTRAGAVGMPSCVSCFVMRMEKWYNKNTNKNKSSVFFAWPIKRTERTFRVHPRRKPTVMSLSLSLFLLLLLFQAMNSDRKCRKKKSNYKWCEDKTANTKLGITLRQSHTRIHTIYLCVAHQAENTEKLNSSNCQHAVRMWLARHCIALHCNECSANKKKINKEVEDSRWGRTKEEKQHQQQQQTTKT